MGGMERMLTWKEEELSEKAPEGQVFIHFLSDLAFQTIPLQLTSNQ